MALALAVAVAVAGLLGGAREDGTRDHVEADLPQAQAQAVAAGVGAQPREGLVGRYPPTAR